MFLWFDLVYFILSSSLFSLFHSMLTLHGPLVEGPNCLPQLLPLHGFLACTSSWISYPNTIHLFSIFWPILSFRLRASFSALPHSLPSTPNLAWPVSGRLPSSLSLSWSSVVLWTLAGLSQYIVSRQWYLSHTFLSWCALGLLLWLVLRLLMGVLVSHDDMVDRFNPWSSSTLVQSWFMNIFH